MIRTFNNVFVILLIFAAVYADEGEQCRAYNGTVGTCSYLRICSSLINMLKNFDSIGMSREQVIEIIVKSNCGFIQSEPLVCCSDNKNILQNTQNAGISITTQIPTQKPLIQSLGAANHAPFKIPEKIPANSIPSFTLPIGAPSNTLSSPIGLPNTPVYEEFNQNTEPATDYLTTILEEKKNLLPNECGRVLTIKYFFGNRTEFDDFPWITLIKYDTPVGEHFNCGGALINKRYVLTAARCIKNLDWKISGVRFGEYDLNTKTDCLPDGMDTVICSKSPVDIRVEKVLVHPGYMKEDRSQLHNIALLRLAEDVKFTQYIKPICLPFHEPVPQRYYTSGWGMNFLRNGTNLKYMSYVSLADHKICVSLYNPLNIFVNENLMCGGKNTEKSCIGDLGGPLMGVEERENQEKRATVFGILSITMPTIGTCQTSKFPGIYTKVYDYMPWILAQLKD